MGDPYDKLEGRDPVATFWGQLMSSSSPSPPAELGHLSISDGVRSYRYPDENLRCLGSAILTGGSG